MDYLGYPDYKYNNINVGALFLRITGSQKIYPLNNSINTFKSNSKGSLLFWANLDPNDFSIYEPKGSLQITIIGGNYFYEKELKYIHPDNISHLDEKNTELLEEYKKIENIALILEQIFAIHNKIIT